MRLVVSKSCGECQILDTSPEQDYDELLALVAGMLLERLGYQPCFVRDSAEALAALRTKPYEVVLMDLEMPVLDGLAATERIPHEFPLGRHHALSPSPHMP